MAREDVPLLNINQDKAPERVSKSFLIIAISFGFLLLVSTVTLAVLYFRGQETIQKTRLFKVVPGDEVLLHSQFSQLAGKRVGLITNPTAMVNNVHIIDWMFFTPNNVNMSLVTLFGPEHGLRGSGAAGAPVANSVDDRTGLPIISLYGNIYAPTPEMIANYSITALVYDIQDVGCRFYTYISTMGLCMQAAAQAGIPFFVLDRPNPIGDGVSGWVLNPTNKSFIGEYPIPIQYGLTAGELALMIQGQGFLSGLENLNLTVIAMKDYDRNIIWTETNLPFISPSPNIVDINTALLYPGTGFFEAFNLATEGRGTLMPFKVLGAPWLDPNSTASLVLLLNSFALPGVSFSPTQFTPVNISDMSGTPKFLNTTLHGVRISVTERKAVKPVELGIHLVYSFYQVAPNDTKANLIMGDSMDLHAGTPQFMEAIVEGLRPAEIIWQWKSPVEGYLQMRKPYLLYPFDGVKVV